MWWWTEFIILLWREQDNVCFCLSSASPQFPVCITVWHVNFNIHVQQYLGKKPACSHLIWTLTHEELSFYGTYTVSKCSGILQSFFLWTQRSYRCFWKISDAHKGISVSGGQNVYVKIASCAYSKNKTSTKNLLIQLFIITHCNVIGNRRTCSFCGLIIIPAVGQRGWWYETSVEYTSQTWFAFVWWNKRKSSSNLVQFLILCTLS